MKVTRKRHYVNETPGPFKQTGINRSLTRGVVGPRLADGILSWKAAGKKNVSLVFRSLLVTRANVNSVSARLGRRVTAASDGGS